MGKYYLTESKLLRQVMLDALEICPRRFREGLMLDFSCIFEYGYHLDDHYSNLLRFFYRLRSGALFKNASPYHKQVLTRIIKNLECAYQHDMNKPYEFESHEMRRMAKREFARKYIAQQGEWCKKPVLLRMMKVNIIIIFILSLIALAAGLYSN